MVAAKPPDKMDFANWEFVLTNGAGRSGHGLERDQGQGRADERNDHQHRRRPSS